jgi:hypothetical protein
MEKLLTNQEFNALLKDIKVEKHDFAAAFVAGDVNVVDNALAKLKTYWKIVRPVLKLVKLVTPVKIDKGIDEFIPVVDRLAGGATGEEQTKLLEKFAMVWGLVKPILEGVTEITPPKADAIIGEVIKIGELLAKS